MAMPSRDLDRYHLPARIRNKRVPAGTLPCQLALADRISELPGTKIAADSDTTPARRVDISLQAPATSLRHQPERLLFCSIDKTGVAVHGLSEWDKHQVLCGGWGRLERDYVLMFMPRDNEELEVCWGVIRRAYSNLSESSAQLPPVRSAMAGRLPRFSRTTLQ